MERQSKSDQSSTKPSEKQRHRNTPREASSVVLTPSTGTVMPTSERSTARPSVSIADGAPKTVTASSLILTFAMSRWDTFAAARAARTCGSTRAGGTADRLAGKKSVLKEACDRVSIVVSKRRKQIGSTQRHVHKPTTISHTHIRSPPTHPTTPTHTRKYTHKHRHKHRYERTAASGKVAHDCAIVGDRKGDEEKAPIDRGIDSLQTASRALQFDGVGAESCCEGGCRGREVGKSRGECAADHHRRESVEVSIEVEESRPGQRRTCW
jgi:hypothetical protein